MLALTALLAAALALAGYQMSWVKEQQSRQRVQDTLWLRQYLVFQLEDAQRKVAAALQADPAIRPAALGLVLRQHPEIVAVEPILLPREEIARVEDEMWLLRTPSGAELRWSIVASDGNIWQARLTLSRWLAEAPWWLAQHYRVTLFDAQGEPLVRHDPGLSETNEAYRTHLGLPGSAMMLELAGAAPLEHTAQQWLLPLALALAAFAAAAMWLAWRASEARQAALQELQWQRERLAARARLITLGEMAAAIAHEINQPLAAITSYASGAQHLLASAFSRCPGAVSTALPAISEALDKIEQLSLRVGKVIQRIRRFTRSQTPRLTRCDLVSVVEETLELVRPQAERSHVALRWVPPPNPIPAYVDPVLLQQAIVNILINALEAAAEPQARAAEVCVHLIEGDGQIEIVVADRGPGVPADVTHRLTEAFVTQKAQGLGLGLWITHAIVEAHAGQFRLQANPEGGAIASILLPRQQRPGSDQVSHRGTADAFS